MTRPATRLWLVRHAPTGAKGMVGWTDLPADLSDLPRLAALRAALPVAPVVSSDLARAVATADALAGGRPRLPHDPGLREMHFGAWEGLTWAEAEARDPRLARALWAEPGRPAPPGGESWDALCRRVWSALDRLRDAGDAGDDVIAVCHFGPILAALQRARGVDPLVAMAQRIEPLSLTVLAWDGAWRVEAANRQPSWDASRSGVSHPHAGHLALFP